MIVLTVGIGASMANAQTFYTVTSLDDVFGNDGVLTLREAIQAANTDSAFFEAPAGNGADFIEFHSDLFTSGSQTLNLAGSELLITDDLMIMGPGRDLLSINANLLSRVFNIDDSSFNSAINVAISDMTVTEGSVDDSGGAIRSRENVMIIDAEITNCLSLSNIIGNDSFRNGGGGIYNWGGTLDIFDSTVSDNFATISGGGIMGSTNSITTITRCVITNNICNSDGGGVGIFYRGTMTINDSAISYNESGSYGGGVFAGGINVFLNIHDSTISNNERGTNRAGGGLSTGATLTITGTTISDNLGGGIFHYGPGSITESVITGNDSSNNLWSKGIGGGIRVSLGSGSFEIIDCSITNNTAGDGGGVFIGGGIVEITGTTIFGNSCITSSDGGGIGGNGGNLTLTNSTVSGNMAGPTGHGGGLHIEDGSWTVRNSTIANNSSDIGGGVRVVSGTLSMDSTIVGDNTATTLADDVSGTVSGQNNLVEDATGAFFVDGINTFGVDPGLQPLFDNGGLTFTHHLAPDSAAINNGSNPAGLLTDQRGQPRVFGGQADIGAVEVQTSGDANGDGVLSNLDSAAFVLALINPVAYQAMFPDVDPDLALDMNGDGVFNNLDIAGFVAALTGGGK